MNINFAFGMILGLVNGPLLKKFGYRKMAATGSILFTTGITLTAFANTFSLIVISYGLLACKYIYINQNYIFLNYMYLMRDYHFYNNFNKEPNDILRID